MSTRCGCADHINDGTLFCYVLGGAANCHEAKPSYWFLGAAWRAGRVRTPLEGTPATTLCDALQASAPGHLTWQVNAPALAGAVWMPDAAAVEAMKVAFTELKLVLEPSGALGLAALLDGRVPLEDGEAVCVVACGGNVALENFVAMMM